MVNRIDGNNYHVYTKQQKKEISGAGEKFSLKDHGNESLQDSGSKYEKDVSDSGKNPFEERQGVKLELSPGRSLGIDGMQQKNVIGEDNTPGQPLLETIRNYVAKAVTAVRDFFYQIWNDEPKDDVAQDNLASMDSFCSEYMTNPMESPTQEKRLSILPLQDDLPDYEIRQSLKEGDMDRVIRLLTDNGKKTAAKNSTLLTSYDRNGKIVEPNASDRGKILYGDKTSLKF